MNKLPFTVWDEGEIRVELAKSLSEEFGEKEAYRLADRSDLDPEWEGVVDDITFLMEKISKTYTRKGYWEAQVSNFGWRSLNGHKRFKATTGADLLREVLPETDCIFRVFRDGREMAIQNFHHDSPSGNEWYHIRHLGAREIDF